MAAKTTKTTLDTLYLINDSNRKVTIEISVGEQAQTSMLSMNLDNVNIIENHSGNLEKTIIDSNKVLHRKKLKIIATITDTSRDTNVTFLNIKLSGGFLTQNYPLYKMVSQEGESVNYYCHIEFFNPTL